MHLVQHSVELNPFDLFFHCDFLPMEEMKLSVPSVASGPILCGRSIAGLYPRAELRKRVVETLNKEFFSTHANIKVTRGATSVACALDVFNRYRQETNVLYKSCALFDKAMSNAATLPAFKFLDYEDVLAIGTYYATHSFSDEKGPDQRIVVDHNGDEIPLPRIPMADLESIAHHMLSNPVLMELTIMSLHAMIGDISNNVIPRVPNAKELAICQFVSGVFYHTFTREERQLLRIAGHAFGLPFDKPGWDADEASLIGSPLRNGEMDPLPAYPFGPPRSPNLRTMPVLPPLPPPPPPPHQRHEAPLPPPNSGLPMPPPQLSPPLLPISDVMKGQLEALAAKLSDLHI